MSKAGLREREPSERTSGMFVDLAGLTGEAIFGPLTDVLPYVLPNKTVSDKFRCSANAWMRQTMELFENLLAKRLRYERFRPAGRNIAMDRRVRVR
nr:hypothetical transcript [Hymenolepis microstoma]